jgi:hypothetical protein
MVVDTTEPWIRPSDIRDEYLENQSKIDLDLRGNSGE